MARGNSKKESVFKFKRHIKDFFQINGLGPRQQDIIGYVMEGFDNKQMSDELGIVLQSVKFQLTEIYKRLKVNDRANLIIKMARYGYFADNLALPFEPAGQLVLPERTINFQSTKDKHTLPIGVRRE